MFVVMSFLNRCLNPFIYASQYEVVRRTWTPLIDFLRQHITGKPTATARIEPMPPSSSFPLSQQAGKQLATSAKKVHNAEQHQ